MRRRQRSNGDRWTMMQAFRPVTAKIRGEPSPGGPEAPAAGLAGLLLWQISAPGEFPLWFSITGNVCVALAAVVVFLPLQRLLSDDATRHRSDDRWVTPALFVLVPL